tara:strand:- start:3553 stop:4746 length:1194 start_codon:yes stop_codon:yes gene_type:complete
MENDGEFGMSVINQMLKDLDKRQNEQQGVASHAVPVQGKTSNKKLLLIVVTIIIILNIVGLFGWQLYSENQQLRSQSTILKMAQSQTAPKRDILSTEGLVSADAIVPRFDPVLVVDFKAKSKLDEQRVDVVELAKPSTLSAATTAKVSLKNQLIESSEKKNLSSDKSEKKPVVEIAPAVEVSKKAPEPKPLNVTVQAKSSLTISRTQLSPQALAANKITEAEQAMERNDISKAEALFEEVLLVMPEHETARKQLAALWYGKRSYQDAVNLLSQGIALAPQAEEMRIMSARIYYEQGQARQAYDILNPVKHSTSTELQALLANASAELNEHANAIIAYRKLINLEPSMGRWWLGLAVSLDSLGKFLPARDAYKQAIARNNLSSSATQFARQRLIELGE